MVPSCYNITRAWADELGFQNRVVSPFNVLVLALSVFHRPPQPLPADLLATKAQIRIALQELYTRVPSYSARLPGLGPGEVTAYEDNVYRYLNHHFWFFVIYPVLKAVWTEKESANVAVVGALSNELDASPLFSLFCRQLKGKFGNPELLRMYLRTPLGAPLFHLFLPDGSTEVGPVFRGGEPDLGSPVRTTIFHSEHTNRGQGPPLRLQANDSRNSVPSEEVVEGWEGDTVQRVLEETRRDLKAGQVLRAVHLIAGSKTDVIWAALAPGQGGGDRESRMKELKEAQLTELRFIIWHISFGLVRRYSMLHPQDFNTTAEDHCNSAEEVLLEYRGRGVLQALDGILSADRLRTVADQAERSSGTPMVLTGVLPSPVLASDVDIAGPLLPRDSSDRPQGGGLEPDRGSPPHVADSTRWISSSREQSRQSGNQTVEQDTVRQLQRNFPNITLDLRSSTVAEVGRQKRFRPAAGTPKLEPTLDVDVISAAYSSEDAKASVSDPSDEDKRLKKKKTDEGEKGKTTHQTELKH
ncbi:hypothetical protein NMY22_g11050 [Coprinellus aureogranulatus]|nr:hypothetical protein NMY22_g11050 [Coprinellus aureogranulatus]